MTPSQLPVWVDLCEPPPGTIADVQTITGLRIPTREELSEIEDSSRLFVENGAVYISIPAKITSPTGIAYLTPLGMILSPDRFVTVHFEHLPALERLAEHARTAPAELSSIDVFAQALETIIEVIADQIERVSADLDRLASTIFAPATGVKLSRLDADLRATLAEVGQNGLRTAKIRDSLLVLGRAVPFVLANAVWIPDDKRPRFKTIRTDVTWLNEQTAHASQQISSLQDATIGFIGIAQSHIIKVLTVVAAIGVPPTLLASMWGMNFQNMPELHLTFGYPLALSAIVLSAALPLAWFRRAGWL